MKILFLIQSLDKSGAPKSLSLIANHFDDCGYEVSIFTESKNVEVDLNKNIRVLNDVRIRESIFGRLKIVKRIREISESNKYNVIITFVPLYILAFLKTESLLIFSDRGLDTRSKAFVIYRLLAKYCDYVVMQTPYAEKNYPNLKTNQVRVIPNAIQPLDYELIPYTERNIIRGKISCSGRLFIQQKRQDVLIRAMKYVHDEFPSACLHIYGDGPDKLELERMIAEQKADGFIKLEGFSYQVVQDIYDSEIFVLCSDYEGLPNSLIEAMQLGLPCIATDCLPGGAKYLLEQGSGMIVERDNPILLAQGICKLLHNTSLQIQFSEKGIERVKEFSEKNIMYKWDMLLETVISAKQSL